MISIPFTEANAKYGPPTDLTDEQVMTIHAYHGTVSQGSVEGSRIVVTAWMPSAAELQAIIKGSPIYLTVLGGLPPHFLSVNFNQATHPA